MDCCPSPPLSSVRRCSLVHFPRANRRAGRVAVVVAVAVAIAVVVAVATAFVVAVVVAFWKWAIMFIQY